MSKKPIAERVLHRIEDGQEVRIQVFPPKKVGADWECRVVVLGLPVEPMLVYGIDSFQALAEAMVASRKIVASHSAELSWVSNVPSDLGIPIVLPYMEFRLGELIEQMIKVEVLRFQLYTPPRGRLAAPEDDGGA